MEEKKQTKLSYEELSKKFGELYAQYQKATEYIQKLQGALNDSTFNQTSFFISMLFKVMEHPEMYNEDFVKWSQENIESALKTFAEAFAEPEKKDEEDKNEEAK